MASNITEGESRIIQLLSQLVDGSARNSTQSESSAYTANGVAIVALTISVIALLATLLQAILEYSGSNENHREKCNVGAIGRAAKLKGVRTWSWHQWRKKYAYPRFEFSVQRIFEAMQGDHDRDTELSKIFRPLIEGQHDETSTRYSWLNKDLFLHHHFRNQMICDQMWVLSRKIDGKWTLVFHRDLPWRVWLRWRWFVASHPIHEQYRPRATWAQLLEALNIIDFKVPGRMPLLVDKIDAECIPSTLDVPTQDVSLIDLGILAFHLGSVSVNIDTKNKEFNAVGPAGSITTEILHGFGTVVRFQRHGNLELNRRSGNMHFGHKDQLFGKLRFHNQPWQYPKIPAYSELGVMLEDFSSSRWPDLGRNIASVLDEADSLRDKITDDRKVPWGRRDQPSHYHDSDVQHRRRWPTILLAASIACLPGQTTGYPAELLVTPFLQAFQMLATDLQRRRNSTYQVFEEDWVTGFGNVLPRTVIHQLLCKDLFSISDIGELMGTPKFCKLTDSGLGDSSSWAFSTTDHTELRQIEKYLTSFCYADLDGSTERRQLTDSNNDEVNIDKHVLPEVWHLIENFDPEKWVHDMGQARSLSRDPDRFSKPKHLLWSQIFILDLKIRELVLTCESAPPRPPRAGFYWAEWSEACNKRTAKAIIMSWDNPRSRTPLLDLGDVLIKVFYPEGGVKEEESSPLKKLADLIKLRALFFVAYLMVIPDSSSLLRAKQSENSDAIVPMI